MCKFKVIACLCGGLLILLAGFHAEVLQASEPTGSVLGHAAEAAVKKDEVAEAGSASRMQATIEELKERINVQQKRIEELQALLERRQMDLNRANLVDAAGNAHTAAAIADHSSEAAAAQNSKSGDPRIEDTELIKAELEAIAESLAETTRRLSKLESDTAAYRKTNDAKIRQIGNFSFSGDIRTRWEPWFQEGAPDRHRERIRIRLNLTGNLSDEISGGISLATGSLDNPISTNQTFTGFFNRKNFAIDRAFITYKPKAVPFLKLEAGKFAYPWYRTPLTFDSDMNPEGFAETLSFDFKSSVLNNITFVGFQLPFNEVSTGHDSFVLGGQLQMQFRLSPKARLALYGAGININRADPIAVSLANGSLRPSLPNSNTYRYSSTGTVTGFATEFAYLDTIIRLDLDTHPRLATNILFNFVNNMRGSRERSAYWAELTFGRQREVGDVQFGYTYIRIEKDAVIGAWNESSLRSSTNVRNHRLIFSYVFKSNFTGQLTAWIGHLANPLDNVGLVPAGVRSACVGADVSGCRDPYLKRLQFDVIYRF